MVIVAQHLVRLLAQASDPPGVTDLLATYGPFAPFAALLLYLLRTLWSENKEKEVEIRRLTATAMEKILPLVVEATRVLAEAMETMHQVRSTATSGPDPVDQAELVAALKETTRVLRAKRPGPKSGGP